MGTIADKLLYLATTKENIRQSIIRKGVDVSETLRFRDYPDKIDQISTGGGETVWENFEDQFVAYEEEDKTNYSFENEYTEVFNIQEVSNVPDSIN